MFGIRRLGRLLSTIKKQRPVRERASYFGIRGHGFHHQGPCSSRIFSPGLDGKERPLVESVLVKVLRSRWKKNRLCPHWGQQREFQISSLGKPDGCQNLDMFKIKDRRSVATSVDIQGEVQLESASERTRAETFNKQMNLAVKTYFGALSLYS